MASEESESWGWVRPLIYGASGLGAVVAALVGVSGSLKDEPAPAGDVGRRLYALELWMAEHKSEIGLRTAQNSDRFTANEASIGRLQGELSELRRRIDELMLERRRSGVGSGPNIIEGVHP